MFAVQLESDAKNSGETIGKAVELQLFRAQLSLDSDSMLMHRPFFPAWRTAIPTRIGVILLGLWLVIAPQWHLCDQGLSGAAIHSCCEHLTAASEASETEAPESCVGEFEVGPDLRFDTFCLARYLEFFSLLSVAAFSFVALIRFLTLRFRVPPIWSLPARPARCASRGPPYFSC